jgi:hypothetical protein
VRGARIRSRVNHFDHLHRPLEEGAVRPVVCGALGQNGDAEHPAIRRNRASEKDF